MTGAGRKALPWLAGARFTGEPERAWEWATEQVALIEAEATAAAEQRLRERIEALRPGYAKSRQRRPNVKIMVDLAAVLALLDTPPPASPRQGEPVDLDVMAEPMRAHIVIGAVTPRTEAGRLWHAEWHSGEYPNAPTECGSMGCGFLGRILGLEAAALSEPAEAGEPAP